MTEEEQTETPEVETPEEVKDTEDTEVEGGKDNGWTRSTGNIETERRC